MVSNFWEIESDGVYKNQSSSILPETEQWPLNFLEEATVNKNSQCTVGILWDSDNVLLANNKNKALITIILSWKKVCK